MKAIILAAGSATRLFPLTKNRAKPLLKVGGKTILDHIMEKVEKVAEIDEVFLVTNNKFSQSFIDWRDGYSGEKRVKVINDQTLSNDDRLGAIADMQYVIEQEAVDDDVMVLAGDNLFDFELTDFVTYYQELDADCITVHELNEREELKQTGVVSLDDQDRVTLFEEKPARPKSNYAVPPFYIYQKETLPLVEQYLKEKHNPDAPGNFIPWLIRRKPVYAYQFEGARYDIGTIESYEKVKRLFISNS